ncbi:hypothetical protein SEA_SETTECANDELA_194 [Mycobacterium phage Settecandela]|nr:hypothetical protein SEA_SETTECANDELA_194 [Mycobacterium phage Settecandela]
MNFDQRTDLDTDVRAQVLAALPGVLDDVRADIRAFEVTRTNDRKGYRDERPYLNNSPYQGSPRTLVRIEVEFYDNMAQAVVDRVIGVERQVLRARHQLEVEAAQRDLEAAQARVDELRERNVP